MATTATVGEFISFNHQKQQHPNIVKLRPGVVRRNRPELEPDRQFVDKAPAAEAPPEMAAKKKPAKRNITDEDRAVAVARVEKLIGAGNATMKAVADVAKELGVSESSIYNWRTAANKSAGKPGKPGRKAKARKVSNGKATNGAPPRRLSKLDQAIAEHMKESPLDVVLDMLRYADKARSMLGDGSRKRLLAELTTRLS